jgi:hypothetical protein
LAEASSFEGIGRAMLADIASLVERADPIRSGAAAQSV